MIDFSSNVAIKKSAFHEVSNQKIEEKKLIAKAGRRPNSLQKIVVRLTGQLIELKKASMARLMCDNSNHVNSIQPEAFKRVSKS